MSEYIDREKAINALRNEMCMRYPSKTIAINAIKCVAPEDIQPVIHGKWINDWKDEKCCCSICNHTCEDAQYGWFKFCPYCGAKMESIEGKV